MKSTAHSRLSKLETTSGLSRKEPLVIVCTIVNPDGTREESPAYTDNWGRIWTRRAGEAFEEFKRRAIREAGEGRS